MAIGDVIHKIVGGGLIAFTVLGTLNFVSMGVYKYRFAEQVKAIVARDHPQPEYK